MKRKNVKEMALALLVDQASIGNRDLASKAGVSRQAAHYHLKALVESGRLVSEGAGRGVRYRLAGEAPDRRDFTYPREGLEEDAVWREMLEGVSWLAEIPENGLSILQYAFTELVNNAVDHSGSEQVGVSFERDEGRVAFEVLDEGVGIFEHLRNGLHLESQLASLQELSKGKITTLPESHTGEGIFFVSKIADMFEIFAGGLHWAVDNTRDDTAVGEAPPRKGTRARFEVSPSKAVKLDDLFAEYTEDYVFNKTRTVVKLFAIGVRFVSRSEAKRLTRGLERFREVILDFEGVASVGQGFVDEVFRVWSNAHPGILLTPVKMNEAVRFMVERARREEF